MNIKMLTEKGKDELFKDATTQKEFYRATAIEPSKYGMFDYPESVLSDDKYPELLDANENEPLWETDFKNSLKVYYFFANNRVPLSLMTDVRYMAYLTHFVFFDYMKKRWPIGEKRNIGRIKSQYFFNRSPSARNGILRLFWPAFLIAQSTDEGDEKTFENKLHCFFRNRIALDRILERNFSRNPLLLDHCIRAIMDLSDESLITSHGRSGLLGKMVVNVLSVSSLDAMDPKDSYGIVSSLTNDIANGLFDYKFNDSDDANVEDDEDAE